MTSHAATTSPMVLPNRGGADLTRRTANMSPQVNARLAGLLYLLVTIASIFSFFYMRSRLIVPGDAIATASNILASQGLFRMGIASDAFVFLSEIVLAALLYRLFKPVSTTLSLATAFARLALAVLQGINLLNYFVVLLLLSGAGYLTVFEPDQLQALALLFLTAYDGVTLIWGTFFGLQFVGLGYLVYKSGYFPRVLGVLLLGSAVGYLTDSFGNFLAPQYDAIYAQMVVVLAIGELVFALWLLIRGLNVAKWEQRARESA